MKTIFKSLTILFFIILTSCTQEKKIFETNIVNKEDKKTLSYLPHMDFKIKNDSAFYYFDQEDFKKILGGNIKLGEDIYQSKNFKVKVILREYRSVDKTEFEIVLRTYGEDFRIIDSFLIASTVEGNLCEGYLTNDLNVIRSCNGETMLAGSINELGKFIIP